LAIRSKRFSRSTKADAGEVVPRVGDAGVVQAEANLIYYRKQLMRKERAFRSVPLFNARQLTRGWYGLR
jgi:hypothetical protein